jgi:hypothetical protein
MYVSIWGQFFWASDLLCLSSSSALDFFQLFFSGPPPGMTDTSLHIQGVWLLSHMVS